MGTTFRKAVNDILVTEVFSRASRGGFLVGDVVLLKKDFKSKPEYKALPEPVRTEFEAMSSSPDYNDKYLRVIGIMPSHPPVNNVAGDTVNVNGAHIKVMYELSPGLYNNVPFVLPPEIFDMEEYSATGYMSPKVPESLIYKGFGDGTAREAPEVKHSMSPTEAPKISPDKK